MKRIVLLIAMYLFAVSLHAQVRFAKIFSDNMVLQAYKPIKIWGNATAGETVKVIALHNDYNKANYICSDPVCHSEPIHRNIAPNTDYGESMILY